MDEIKKSGRIFSICDCAVGKDTEREKEEIAECQKKQACYKPWDRMCYYYRYNGHCDKVENPKPTVEISTEFYI